MGEFVTISTDEAGVATLRLDRPPVNALDLQVWDELGAAAAQLSGDDHIKAVVLWGGEKVFCAGADVEAMSGLGFTGMFAHGGGLQDALRALAEIPKVVIAAINGYALGGGCELALTADFRYAAENARMGQPEILLGLIPGAGGTQRLQRIVGVTRAKQMVYSGRFYDAQECLEMGLVSRVLPAGEVYEAAVADARGYARGPYALRMAKQALDQGGELDLDAALRLEGHLFAACFATEDAKAGMASFLEHGPGQAEFTQR